MISFAWPWLFLMLPLGILVYLFTPALSKERAEALYVPFFSVFKQWSSGKKVIFHSSLWQKFCFFAALVFFTGALMRPQLAEQPIPLAEKSRNLMMAVDISGSMAETDFSLNGRQASRLDVVKKQAFDFLEKRKGDKIGLILFADQAFLAVPLTMDHSSVQEMLREAEVGMAGQQTALGDAVGLALKKMEKLPDESKVLILLSDGVANAGALRPEEAAQAAKEAGVRIYTIGLVAENRFFSTFFGNFAMPTADLDEETLLLLAEKTGGRYFKASDTKQLKDIYEIIDKLEPVETKDRYFRPVKELFYLPLCIGMILFWLAFLTRGNGR
jgi:Ca-activated chloride channel homolog